MNKTVTFEKWKEVYLENQKLKAENERLKTFNQSLNSIKDEAVKRLDLIRTSSKKDYVRNMEQQLKEKDDKISRYKNFLATRQFTDEEFSFEKIEKLKSQIREKDEHIKVLLENELDKTKRLLSANTKQVCEKIRKEFEKRQKEWNKHCQESEYNMLPDVAYEDIIDQIERGESDGPTN